MILCAVGAECLKLKQTKQLPATWQDEAKWRMRKMWARTIVISSFFLLSLSGCATGTQGTFEASEDVSSTRDSPHVSPEEVVHRYFEALRDNHVDTYLSCLYLDAESAALPGLREMSAMVVQRFHSRFLELGGLKQVSAVVLKQDGNSATVGVHLLFHGGKIAHGGILYLVRDEDWKIDVSPLIE